ncbi:GH25 family lysozyme [Lentzea sp. NBRC 102530]|uniref:GH25 family lysozyme n=1 Tax=Lentzea sp. NBRC 102530 TaxID=3032201 RepID=UPI0024A0E413|nr:GH25 family lysozyme [Lentzea sp. NBRC 102530]GLY55357.1 hypothetical protein Lesp01_90120 [Lentzea sp. NBRC 102530]
MGVFGVDVSNHQPTFDFAAAKRNGFEFAFLKATEGSGFKDAYFARHLREARANGMLVAAYHYQRTNPVADQVANIKSMVSTDVPIIIDVEHGSAGVDITRALVDALRRAGYTVPLTYLPRWYWTSIGSPSLAGLPALWASWYPDYQIRSKEAGISLVPPNAWSNYGGLNVAMMQFTSSPYDQNFFRGTRQELAELLGGNGVDDMGWTDPIKLTAEERIDADGQGEVTFIAGTWLKFASLYAGIAKTAAEEAVKVGKENAAKLAELEAKVDRISVGGVDSDALADKVADRLAERMAN